MTTGVYGLFDAKNGTCLYVGQSKNVQNRFRQHITKLKNKRSRALDKFVEWYHSNGASEEILEFKILEECANDEYTKNFLESKWYYELKPVFAGKIPSMNESWEHSEETKAAIRAGVLKNLIPRPPLPFCAHCGDKRVNRKLNKFCSPTCSSLFDKIQIDIDLLEKMYLDDSVSLNEICERFQINGVTVLDRLKSRGITSRLSKMIRQKDLVEILTKETLYDLYWSQHLSVCDIATQFNTSDGVIKSLLKKFEIPMKSRSEAMKDKHIRNIEDKST